MSEIRWAGVGVGWTMGGEGEVDSEFSRKEKDRRVVGCFGEGPEKEVG